MKTKTPNCKIWSLKLLRRECPLLLLLILPVAAVSGAESGETLWTIPETQLFCQSLSIVEQAKLEESMGEYYTSFLENEDIDINNIKNWDIQSAVSAIDRAIELEWGIINLFTDRNILNNSNCGLLIDSETLQQIDKKYNLHSLWLINSSNSRNEDLKMQYIIVSEGRLFIGYPKKQVVHVSDYNILTGRYTYPPYLSADIESSQDRQGVFNMETLESPGGNPGLFTGPLGRKIRNLQLTVDNKISNGVWLPLDSLPIELR